jgi:surfactin synthase thioesterase subunit
LCFPHAGGGAALYRRWPALLPGELDLSLYAVQPPGRENRIGEPAIRDLTVLVDALVEATRAQRAQPYALFGHSVGALVAFELTRALRRRGENLPSVLFVSGCGAPQQGCAERAYGELDDAAFVERLRRFEGTPEGALENAELRALLLPTLRADLGLRDGYRCASEPPLVVPIVAFGGEDDPDVTTADLCAWSAQTCTSFRVKRFPGGHFFLKSAARELLVCVAEELVAQFENGANTRVFAHEEATRESFV